MKGIFVLFLFGLFLLFFWIIVYIYKKNKEKSSTNKIYISSSQNIFQPPKVIKGSEIILATTKTTMSDTSVIDVSNESYKIPQYNVLKKCSHVLPFWSHKYIYSYDDILTATNEQRRFYDYFKNCFLKGEFLDLEGNNNYAFILLFDLLNEFKNHSNSSTLERQLLILGQYYPKTKPYGITFWKKIRNEQQAKSNVIKLENGLSISITSNFSYSQSNSHTSETTDDTSTQYYSNWKIGAKYKDVLKIPTPEQQLLDTFYYSGNNFYNIEQCSLETVKLFVTTIRDLKYIFNSRNLKLEEELLEICDICAKKLHRYKTGSPNYKYFIKSVTNEIYLNIFKLCENSIRDFYFHKRKLNVDIFNNVAEAKLKYTNGILSNINDIHNILKKNISPPNEVTEIELNTLNTNRWKQKFEVLISNPNSNSNFIKDIIKLGDLNKKNPSIENIFFAASKFISKHNRSSALILYIYYIYYDLKSETFDNKQLTKTIQKVLFDTNEQLHDFQIILSDLISDKDLDKALDKVNKFYIPKRKKIKLSKNSIEVAIKEHFGTVDLLSEYLKDDYEDANNHIMTQEVNKEEVIIEIIKKNDINLGSIYIDEIALTKLSVAALDLFAKNNFTVSMEDLKDFAKANGAFENQLIDSLNEICYEKLDDVLIEKEENFYILNPDYYKILLKQCH